MRLECEGRLAALWGNSGYYNHGDPKNTVNPQKLVRLYFQTLVFLVRLSLRYPANCKG